MSHLKVLAAATGIPCDQHSQHLPLALRHVEKLTEEQLAARNITPEELHAAIEAVNEVADHVKAESAPQRRIVIPQPSAEGEPVVDDDDDDTEEVETQYTRTQIRDMRKDDLIALCNILGIDASGTNKAKEDRIIEHLGI